MTFNPQWQSSVAGTRKGLVERAVDLRRELVQRHQTDVMKLQTTEETEANRRYWLARQHFQAAIAALPRQDRLARRLSDQWLELADRVFGSKHLGLQTSEDVAWSFLRKLATGNCPKSAPREVARSAKGVPPGDWLFDWKDEVRGLGEILRFTWGLTPVEERRSALRRRRST